MHGRGPVAGQLETTRRPSDDEWWRKLLKTSRSLPWRQQAGSRESGIADKVTSCWNMLEKGQRDLSGRWPSFGEDPRSAFQ